MIIDVAKLNARKEYSGTLEFTFTADDNLIDLPFTKFGKEVIVQAEYELYEDDSFELKGKVRYVLTGLCSTCLEPTTAEIEGEIDALFERGEGEDYVYTGNRIDLTDAVNDAILSSMPRVLSCGENCKGIEYRETDE